MTVRDIFFYITGIGFLILAKTKNLIKGYSSPKPFDISQVEKCIDYDIQVVDHWLSHLRQYTNEQAPLSGKNVLELGPGSDLGTGLYLMAKGCLQYNACDVNNLIKTVPDSFYELFLEKLHGMDTEADIDQLREQLKKATAGKPSQLNYTVRDDFDIVQACGESTIDLVFSQAAFEHFDDIEKTISQLSVVCKPGARLIIEIDLKTHSRWICHKDPNNIYRYPEALYNTFWFRGIPNRIRPFQYKETFERFGWRNITITPLETIDNKKISYSGMNKAFVNEKNQMAYLSIMLCASKDEIE